MEPDTSSVDGLVLLDGEHLRLDEVAAVARRRFERVELAEAAREAMERSRRRVAELADAGEPVYGVTTGFGHFADVRVEGQRLDELQANLIRSHAVGTGEPLPREVVRAILLLRANVLARGRSGVRPVLVDHLTALLEADVCPVVPRQGSVGASGDLAPSAHVALVLMGEGEARVGDRRLPGRRALEHAGLSPLRFEAKEGLALLNGTQVMTALGVLACHRLETICSVADAAGALTTEALEGRTEPFGQAVAELRPHAGHARTAANLRRLLRGSELVDPPEGTVQDAYSIRCMPQVHGAARDQVRTVREILATEVNAVTDNPVVLEDGRVISCGNFHGQPVAAALDWLTMAAADLASIGERRINRLVNPALSGLPAFLVEEGGVRSGYLLVQTAAASLVNECRCLAVPASVDNVPTSADQEDHVSMGVHAGWKAYEAVANCRRVLAMELLCATEAVEFRGVERSAPALRRLVGWVRERVPSLADGDRPLGSEIDGLADELTEDDLTELLEVGERGGGAEAES